MMATTNPSLGFAEHLIEQAEGLDGLYAKRFFSGTALNIGDLQLGFVSSEEELFLRLTEADREELAALGGVPFSYGRSSGKTTSTPGYFSVPADIVEDRDALNDWLHRAFAYARASYKPKKKRG